MSDEVHHLCIQIRAPRGTFPGEVAEGWYVVVDNAVVLTDADGKPVDSEKRYLNPGDDARAIACVMVRQRRRNTGTVTGFHDKLNYPKLRY
jgi:hypothetical protein